MVKDQSISTLVPPDGAMPDFPNIVFILTDDQGDWALGAAGNPEIHTPRLDRLAAEGLRFSSFFCASPVCSPARASILTGRIPSQHGVHDWIRRGNLPAEIAASLGKHNFGQDNAAIEYLRGMRAYTEALAEAGYTCGLSGKWHLGDSLHPQKGFSFWQVIPYGGSDYFDAPLIRDGQVGFSQGYLTDVITRGALDFLEQQAGSPRPFYLGVHYTAPHSPWDAHQHPADLRALYRDCPFESVPQPPAHPWQINSTPRGVGERRRELLTGYYASISGVDRGVGQILDWLEAHHLRENTLVIFSGDNGMNMGHHGIWGKGNGTFPQNMYDTSVKVPVLMALPGRLPAGALSDDLLSHYDLMPTLLDYLGLPHPDADRLPGRSFAALLRGEPLQGREQVVVYDEYGPTRMIRGRRWKYVHRYPYGPHELYDLLNDPGEERNLYGEEGAADTAAALKAELDEWFARYADPRMDGSREAVYGKGQLDLAGAYGPGGPAHAHDWWYIDENGKRRS
jgi:choline-sulfatase